MQAMKPPAAIRGSHSDRTCRIPQPGFEEKNAKLELSLHKANQTIMALRAQLQGRAKEHRAAMRSKDRYTDQVLELRGTKPRGAAVAVIKTREHAGKRAPCTAEHVAHAVAVVHASGGAGITLSRDREGVVRDWFQTRPT